MSGQTSGRDNVLTGGTAPAKKRKCQTLPICHITNEFWGNLVVTKSLVNLRHQNVRGGNQLTLLDE